MIRQEIEIFCHRYRGTDHPLLISTFDDHRPHIKTDYKRVAKDIDQIAGSPSKAIYLWKNIHFDRNKNFEIFLFSNRISLVSKIIYIEIRGSRDRHGIVLLFWGFWMLIQCLFCNENFNLSLSIIEARFDQWSKWDNNSIWNNSISSIGELILTESHLIFL